ncbi:MAG: ubiquinone/menaquinone biosynthesis methyltransferase [Thermoplasmata archaeon]|nr:ubiquinone/menaquinone biosynthesis methyltransferase [Thermoplasmata archaeon]
MKKTQIQKFYFHISDNYEMVNRIITMGLDRPWRRSAAKLASSHGGTMWLDMCCGTGDMAIDLGSHIGPETTLVMADFSLEMLEIAKTKEELEDIDMALADAFNLPFKDNSFDLVTISFATRNLNLSREKLVRAFSEFNRVLKPDGKLVNIETSQPRSRFVRTFFHLYVKAIVTPVGYLFTENKTSYRFLTSSIINYYNPQEFNAILAESDFSNPSFQPLSFGAVSIHSAVKPSTHSTA